MKYKSKRNQPSPLTNSTTPYHAFSRGSFRPRPCRSILRSHSFSPPPPPFRPFSSFDHPAIFCVHAGIITDLSFATFTVSFRLDPLFSRPRLFARLRSRSRLCVPAESLKWRSLAVERASNVEKKTERSTAAGTCSA